MSLRRFDHPSPTQRIQLAGNLWGPQTLENVLHLGPLLKGPRFFCHHHVSCIEWPALTQDPLSWWWIFKHSVSCPGPEWNSQPYSFNFHDQNSPEKLVIIFMTRETHPASSSCH